MKFAITLLLILSSTISMAQEVNGIEIKKIIPKLPAIVKGPAVNYTRTCPGCEKFEVPAVLTDITDSSAKLNSPINKQNIELSILTPDKAQEIFDKLSARDDIPFKYAKDGCFSRAHKMVTILDEEKIVAGKVFAQGKFYAQTLSGPVFWTYHVAPIILVKTENEIVPYVLDPSMFKMPVPLKEWRQSLKKSPRSVYLAEYYTNRFSYNLDDKDKSYDSYTEFSLSSMNTENQKFLDLLK